MLVLVPQYFPGLIFFITCGNLENKVENKSNGRNWPCIQENKCFQPSNIRGDSVHSSLNSEKMQQL